MTAENLVPIDPLFAYVLTTEAGGSWGGVNKPSAGSSSRASFRVFVDSVLSRRLCRSARTRCPTCARRPCQRLVPQHAAAEVV